jgi:hypothetical protein
MSTILSNRQHALVETFAGNGEGYMTIEEAMQFDQRPFRSLLIRDWVGYRPGRGFYFTREGKKAWSDFHSTEIVRRNPMLPLCAYFRDKYDAGGTLTAKKPPKRAKGPAKVHTLPVCA